jgi:carbonic anhydrase
MATTTATPKATRTTRSARVPAVQKLSAGIHHFQANYFARNRELFERLAEGQRPETLFITCSDSRIDPNLLTSTRPGELFIVRNVGNIVPNSYQGALGGNSAAIEFAVEVLEVSSVIVCGHTHCGAIDAILHPEKMAHLPFVKRWLAEVARIPKLIDDRYGHLDHESRVIAAIEENVLVGLENLRTFDCVARRLDAGKLKMSGWVYAIATGDVYDYDPVTEQFLQVQRSGEHKRTSLSSRPPPPNGT